MGSQYKAKLVKLALDLESDLSRRLDENHELSKDPHALTIRVTEGMEMNEVRYCLARLYLEFPEIQPVVEEKLGRRSILYCCAPMR